MHQFRDLIIYYAGVDHYGIFCVNNSSKIQNKNTNCKKGVSMTEILQTSKNVYYENPGILFT